MEAQRQQYEAMMAQRKAQYEAAMAQRKKMIEERRRAIAQRQRLLREAALAEAIDSVDAQQDQKEAAQDAAQARQPSPFGPRKAAGAGDKPAGQASSNKPAAEETPAAAPAVEPRSTLPDDVRARSARRRRTAPPRRRPLRLRSRSRRLPPLHPPHPLREARLPVRVTENANTLPGGRPSPFGPRK